MEIKFLEVKLDRRHVCGPPDDPRQHAHVTWLSLVGDDDAAAADETKKKLKKFLRSEF